jgi:hypothetical protein
MSIENQYNIFTFGIFSQILQRFSDGCARALAGRLSAAIPVCELVAGFEK